MYFYLLFLVVFILTLSILQPKFPNARISVVIASTIDGRLHVAAVVVSGVVDARVGLVDARVGLVKTTVAVAAIVLGLRLSLSLPLAITISTVAHAIDGGPHIAAIAVTSIVGLVETTVATIAIAAAIVLGLRLSLRLSLSLPLAITISTEAIATIDGGPHIAAIGVTSVVKARVGPVKTTAIGVVELGLSYSSGDKDEGKLEVKYSTKSFWCYFFWYTYKKLHGCNGDLISSKSDD